MNEYKDLNKFYRIKSHVDHISAEPKEVTLSPVIMTPEELRRSVTYPEVVELTDALSHVVTETAITEFRFPNLVVNDEDEVAFRSWCSAKNIAVSTDPVDCKYILTRQER